MHIKIFILILIGFGLLSAGCNLPTPTDKNKADSLNHSLDISQSGLAQKNILIKDKIVRVEITDTDQTRTMGLSNRNSLTPNTGMLFDFTNTTITQPGFWMKDMNFNIDIIWINKDTIIKIDHNVPKQDNNDNLPTYSPGQDITHVLEVPAGFSEQTNLKPLDKVSL